MNLKHPDDALAVAEVLKAAGYSFELNLIGGGPMEQTLRDMIHSKGLGDCVHLLGTMTPEMVRSHMEKSEIFLFTSDRNEGWGAVLNEAMNSGCCVVASDAIGAVPYLLRDGENGLVYRSGNVDEICEKVKSLLEDPGQMERLGTNAYLTIAGHWNAEVAAQHLICLIEKLLNGKSGNQLFAEGPCSPAPCIGEDWYRKHREII